MLKKNLKFYGFSVRTYNKSGNQNFKVHYRNEDKRRFYGKINTILKPVHQKYDFKILKRRCARLDSFPIIKKEIKRGCFLDPF